MTRLSRFQLLAYAAPGLPGAMLLLPLYVHLPTFYAEQVGLGLSVVGGVLLAARLWDIAIDPAIGWLSDRTRSRLGRRKPWLIGALLPILLSAWMLFVPPEGAGWQHLLLWTMLLYLGAAMLQIPYLAWGAELSPDYAERTRITGWREALIVAGTLIAVLIPALLPQHGLAALALTISVLLPPAVLLACLRLRHGDQTASATAPLDRAALRQLWRNGPFRRLLLAWLLNGTANGLPATLVLLYVSHVLHMPELAGAVLLAYFAAGIAAVPLWLWLAGRFGKHRVWCGAMLWTCGFFLLVPLLGPGDGAWFIAISVLTGLSLGADLALPPAMQADVIDLDEARHGRQRAGLFFALWGMATKAALAAAVGIAFPLLDLFGFSALGNNSAAALFGLTALYCLAPVGFKLAAILLMLRYPLGPARQIRLRLRIERRGARRAAAG